MATTYTYPHWETNVIDRSIYTPLEREILPLFRPIFFMRTQKGTTGIPVWVNTYDEAKTEFGEATFDFDNATYFSREALFLRGLFARQGAYVVRMCSSDATYGSLVLELRVKKVQVPQYERDTNGQFVLDPDTNEKIPLINSGTGTQVTEAGVELKWTTRAMTKEEGLDGIKPTTYGTGENEYTVYPILACKAMSVGAYANDVGVKLFVDLDDLDSTLAENVAALPYSFGAVEKTYGEDTISPIYSSFDNQYQDFVAKPDATDERTSRDVSFDKIIANYYADELPFDIYLYVDNIKTIGEIIQDVEPEDDTLFDPFMVNLTEPYNIDGVPMPHVVMSTEDDAVSLTDSRILYLQGGTDGTMTDEAVEALTRQYLDKLIYPKIIDQARYQFTHMIDTGVSLETKESMIGFLGKHDAFKVILSTQDANMGRLNTEEEDLSINLTCGC